MKSIEDKVTIILDAPLKLTVKHFKSFINRLQNQLYEDAFEKLKLVIEVGETALVHSDRNEISLDVYKDIINITKILVFANILSLSYDKDQKMFLAHEILPSNKKNAICEEIEEYMRTLAELKKKVNVKSYLLESTKKKSKLQDLHDSVLTVVYPYIR